MYSSVLIFGMVTVCYALFFFVSYFAWKKGQLGIAGRNGLVRSLEGVNIKNFAGIILLGLPLLLFVKLWAYLLAWPASGSFIKMMVVLFLVTAAGLLALWNAKKKSGDLEIIESKTRQLLSSEIHRYLVVRIGFLIVYECFFRGLLLAVCAGIYGIPAAIGINLIFYTGIHFFNGRREMLSCIPFGLILCGLATWSQSVFPAIALHLVLALVYENYLLFLPDHSPKTPES